MLVIVATHQTLAPSAEYINWRKILAVKASVGGASSRVTHSKNTSLIIVSFFDALKISWLIN